MNPHFVGISGRAKGNEYKTDLIFGRDAGSDVCFADDSAVSRQHSMSRRRDGKTVISDLGSRNGTFVNGARLAPHEERVLAHGDIVKIGDCRFLYLEREEPAAKSAAVEHGEADRIRRMSTIRKPSLGEIVAQAGKEVAGAVIELASAVNHLSSSED